MICYCKLLAPKMEDNSKYLKATAGGTDHGTALAVTSN